MKKRRLRSSYACKMTQPNHANDGDFENKKCAAESAERARTAANSPTGTYLYVYTFFAPKVAKKAIDCAA